MLISIVAALAIKSEVVIPMHLLGSNPEDFKKKVESNSAIKVVVLRPGEQFEVR